MNPVYIEVEIQSNNQEFDLETSEVIGGRLPLYEGAYSVEPRKVQQTLETKDKSMARNVTVEAIHFSEVENPSGGMTVNIGFE